MTSRPFSTPIAHFIERIRTLFSGREHVFVLKNKVQTVVFEEQSPDIGQIFSLVQSILTVVH